MSINTKKLLGLLGNISEEASVVSSANLEYVEKFSQNELAAVSNYKDASGYNWPDPPNTYTGKNGNLPDSNMKYLGEIGMGKWKLRTDAANAFIRLVKDARKVGINPGFTGNKQAYRDYAGQYSLLDPSKWVASGKKNGYGIYRTVDNAIAARPGTSNHGEGIAIDIQNHAATKNDFPNSTKHRVQCWMKWFGGEYGWVWVGSMFKENWHFEYRPEAWEDRIMGFNDTVKNSKYGRYDWGFKSKSSGGKISGFCNIGRSGKVGNLDIKSLKP